MILRPHNKRTKQGQDEQIWNVKKWSIPRQENPVQQDKNEDVTMQDDTSPKVNSVEPQVKKVKIDEEAIEISKVSRIDLGGQGDCCWRCIAVGLAVSNGKNKQDMIPKAAAMGLAIKEKTMAWMSTHDDWKSSWRPDGAATEEKEGGTIPKSREEMLKALERQKRWICRISIACAAKAVNRDLWVLKTTDGKTQIAGKFQRSPDSWANMTNTIVLSLQDDHYQLCEPPENGWPEAWKKLTPVNEPVGGAGSARTSSGASWMRSKTAASIKRSTRKKTTDTNKASNKSKKERDDEAIAELDEMIKNAPKRPKTQWRSVFDDGERPNRESSRTWTCPVCAEVIALRGGNGQWWSHRNHLRYKHPAEYNQNK